jgi:tetratricopeptide (TPR) repeat protein
MKKVLITLTLLTLTTVWSCKDKFLEFSPPPNQLTDATAFKTTEQFNTFIVGTYTELLTAGDWVQLAGYLTQDVLDVGEQRKVLTEYVIPTEGAIKNYWQSMYIIANRSNILLEKVKEAPAAVSATDRARIEGESKFLRGFAYFNIARAYGNAPLLLESYSTPQTIVSCTPEDKIWDQVILDLVEASQKLPRRAEWGDANYGRATKGSALAFLANAYMYKKDWPNAAKASQELIALNDYELADDVRKAFTETLTPAYIKESIFEVQFRDGGFEWSNNKQTGSLIGPNTSPRNIGGEIAPFGGWGEMVLDRSVKNSMDPLDDRRKLIYSPGETYKGERMTTPFTLGVTRSSKANPDGTFTLLTTPQTKVDWSTKYWLGPAGDVTGSNIPMMRYAEFLLNYAEILFEQGKTTEAYDQLNAVRRRAKLLDKPVSSDRAVFMTDLMNERRWELNMELNLWFHYTRTGTAEAFFQSKGITFQPKWNKLPIPQDDRDQNPNICQNTGY